MATLLPTCAQIGRLYEPLFEVATRIHVAAKDSAKTVWRDGKGALFAQEVGAMESIPLGSVIGTYNGRTRIAAIEEDLRLALRERASAWIVDWDDRRTSSQLGRAPIRRRHRAFI